MEITIQEEKQKKVRSYKLILLFGMLSMFMMFAGLTSAYLVSASRKDWVHDMVLPPAFMISTVVIILSSVTIHLAKLAIRKDNRAKVSLYLGLTLVLGLVFVFLQFTGFSQIVAMGYYFTGSESTVTTSFLYMLTLLHLVHLFAGVISLLIIIYNHYKQKYNSTQTSGIELGAMFWHFLDFLWVYLFLFLYFV
ncbi:MULTISPECIES: cytochrome c oxidase subunit 3 [Flavobacterium]|uniref:Heme-copper oxidase subunit III n=2 Tax=Flavobacterium TaxID=237 RepID=A0AA94F2X6_9FLAO|nr:MULTISPECIES: cytochrome c oxidase subunit 3 [Flavobacterium]OXA83025.1 cytochrome oxidase subunit III [Flavobacterium columnare NBRC 100251 = ATCC 23463]AMA50192.1 cytochrome oxidase subunit III [Flavobacterium covae]AND64288.1 cytochrome oxidase subunit III [Flavobacterium covae]MCH4829407.1 cytochrome c oxidase subunit 3 [Flavobacterium columnare]MCH4834184.1 cytochrome c oxidase subunit 3 [Flavobacterium columnare]